MNMKNGNLLKGHLWQIQSGNNWFRLFITQNLKINQEIVVTLKE